MTVLTENEFQDDLLRNAAAQQALDLIEHGDVWGWHQFTMRLEKQRSQRRH